MLMFSLFEHCLRWDGNSAQYNSMKPVFKQHLKTRVLVTGRVLFSAVVPVPFRIITALNYVKGQLTKECGKTRSEG